MIYSISHNDMDGFASQLIVVDSTKNEEHSCFNVNYGKPITNAITEVLSTITEADTLYITDVNLEESQALTLDNAFKVIGFSLVVLDHHETGKNVAAKYDWYTCDKTKCGTKLAYEYFGSDTDKFGYLSYLVNIYDLYQIEELDIEKAKSLNQAFIDRRSVFPKTLENSQREYLFHTLRACSNVLLLSDSIEEAEYIYPIKDRKYFSKQKDMSSFSLNTIKVKFMYSEIIDQNLFTTIEVDGIKGEVYLGLSSIFQEFSNLRNNLTSIGFVCNINKQGYIGFRSVGNVSVEKIAKKYFNGGGHKNASGGSLPGVKEGKKYKEEDLLSTFLNEIKGN